MTDARSGPGPLHTPWIIAVGIVVAAAMVSLTLVLILGGEGSPVSAEPPVVASPHAQRPPEDPATAQNREAQSALRNATVAAMTLFTDTRSFASADPTGLATVEPSLCYVDPDTTSSTADPACGGSPSISVSNSDTVWAAARMSFSGTCFWIKDDIANKVTYGSGLPCTATAARKAADSSW